MLYGLCLFACVVCVRGCVKAVCFVCDVLCHVACGLCMLLCLCVCFNVFVYVGCVSVCGGVWLVFVDDCLLYARVCYSKCDSEFCV